MAMAMGGLFMFFWLMKHPAQLVQMLVYPRMVEDVEAVHVFVRVEPGEELREEVFRNDRF